MTKRFHFIRHAESWSNAGLKTDHPQTIPLTPKGHWQAQTKAAAWGIIPDAIITSPYLRTQQTAAPFFQKHPQISNVEWPIHEFTYLSPARYKNTTIDERAPYIDSYWLRADPDGLEEGAESFRGFIDRCKNALDTMQKSPNGTFAVFSHGYFIKGLLLLLEGRITAGNAEEMKTFLEYHHLNKIENCAELVFTFDAKQNIHLKEYIPFETSEIEPDILD